MGFHIDIIVHNNKVHCKIKNERLFQPSFGYLSFMPLCSASLNTRESHWLLYIPNSNGQFFRTFNLVNAEEG